MKKSFTASILAVAVSAKFAIKELIEEGYSTTPDYSKPVKDHRGVNIACNVFGV